MPVSGLIVRLSEGAAGDAGLAALEARSELTLGRPDGRLVPVALDARDTAHSRELHDWLTGLPGVEFVDVVCVNFECDTVPVGGAGDSPAPSGDSSDGIGATSKGGENIKPGLKCPSIPSGESPDGTGQWPMLPTLRSGAMTTTPRST